MDVIAHRGLHDAVPENSLAAIDAAIQAGLTLIEVDVRAAADGTLFLLHDATLDRTTRYGGRLAALPGSRAAQIRLTDGSRLPRLEDALDLCAGRAVLCLDVKVRSIAERLMRILRGREAGVEVWSGHVPIVARAAAAGVHTVQIASGLMPYGIGAFIWRAQEIGARGLSFYPADLEPHVAAACRNTAMPFLCGVPNDEGSWQLLLHFGARAAITDRPLDCQAWLCDAARNYAPAVR